MLTDLLEPVIFSLNIILNIMEWKERIILLQVKSVNIIVIFDDRCYEVLSFIIIIIFNQFKSPKSFLPLGRSKKKIVLFCKEIEQRELKNCKLKKLTCRSKHIIQYQV